MRCTGPFLKYFFHAEASIVLSLFLNFKDKGASCSYQIVRIRKKCSRLFLMQMEQNFNFANKVKKKTVKVLSIIEHF